MFSDDEDQITNDEMEDFIDDVNQQEDGISFHRQLDPENVEHYHKFSSQTKNPKEAVYEDDEPYYGSEDIQSELYNPEKRKFVDFNKFHGF